MTSRLASVSADTSGSYLWPPPKAVGDALQIHCLHFGMLHVQEGISIPQHAHRHRPQVLESGHVGQPH